MSSKLLLQSRQLFKRLPSNCGMSDKSRKEFAKFCGVSAWILTVFLSPGPCLFPVEKRLSNCFPEIGTFSDPTEFSFCWKTMSAIFKKRLASERNLFDGDFLLFWRVSFDWLSTDFFECEAPFFASIFPTFFCVILAENPNWIQFSLECEIVSLEEGVFLIACNNMWTSRFTFIVRRLLCIQTKSAPAGVAGRYWLHGEVGQRQVSSWGGETEAGELKGRWERGRVNSWVGATEVEWAHGRWDRGRWAYG